MMQRPAWHTNACTPTRPRTDAQRPPTALSHLVSCTLSHSVDFVACRARAGLADAIGSDDVYIVISDFNWAREAWEALWRDRRR